MRFAEESRRTAGAFGKHGALVPAAAYYYNVVSVVRDWWGGGWLEVQEGGAYLCARACLNIVFTACRRLINNACKPRFV